MVEEYEDMENDAPDASDVTSATVWGHEHEALRQTTQIARQLEVEVEKNQSGNLEALKTTSGNAAKRLEMRQGTCVSTRVTKTGEAAMKQIATREL